MEEFSSWIYVQVCGFVRFRPERPFLGKFGPKKKKKIKTASVSLNLVSRVIRICRLNGDVHFFRFCLEIPFLGKLCPKNPNC